MIPVVILVVILAASSRQCAHIDSRGGSGCDSRVDSDRFVSTVTLVVLLVVTLVVILVWF